MLERKTNYIRVINRKGLYQTKYPWVPNHSPYYNVKTIKGHTGTCLTWSQDKIVLRDLGQDVVVTI